MRPFWLLFLPAAAYQILSIAGSLNHLRRRRKERNRKTTAAFQPPVSVLKPLRGLDPNTLDAFHSQAQQDYPEFELLFGVATADDPAVREVESLQSVFGPERVRLVIGSESLPNGKVGVLAHLAKQARFPVWVVNDSDIRVTPEYLSRVIAPLVDATVGVVTCLYRARPHSRPAWWEALGIATDFMPSTVVAQLIGVREFGLGSTLAFRAADFEHSGGFAAIGGFLADDYQLASRITAGGKRAHLSTYTVETSLGDNSWLGMWRHQLRWARTIRASKGAGYAGLPIAQGGLWIAVAFVTGAILPGSVLLALRLIAALLAGVMVLESRPVRALFWLSPLWDLYSFAVWLASYAGRDVRWRDKVLQIDRQGRIRGTTP